MKDLFLGWLLKPKYLVTTLDGIILVLEIFTILFILSIIFVIITEIVNRKDKFKNESKIKFCSNCGAENDGDAKECHYCGAKGKEFDE